MQNSLKTVLLSGPFIQHRIQAFRAGERECKSEGDFKFGNCFERYSIFLSLLLKIIECMGYDIDISHDIWYRAVSELSGMEALLIMYKLKFL